MSHFNRRKFLKATGIGLMPALLPVSSVLGADTVPIKKIAAETPLIKFWGDGEMFEPGDYIHELHKANTTKAIVKDGYGSGGAVETLEQKFAAITGKEKAIFMPSGTMANQLAIAVLSGNNAKVFLQDTSHVYRDEADAAQTIFQKRLMPLARNETYFTAQQLQSAIENLGIEEVFKSGIGAVAIENPVRRTDGKVVPIEEIKKISEYCRSKKIGLHLDGARIYMAAAATGISIKEYAIYFDTVYISLYKYFGASGGAVLCGSNEVISKMPHLIKVHGGNMYGNWTNAAMALHRMEGFESRLADTITRSNEIFLALNKFSGIKINPLPDGTNIYSLQLANNVDGKKFQQTLRKEFNISLAPPDDKNHCFITINETLLYQTGEYVINAFKKSIA
ncbi:MAG: aminotransferase class I/II-fold pyridoxal phosphate-dependent enzyme [Chitinophagaceae bacterium]